jgi:hypothetical protein
LPRPTGGVKEFLAEVSSANATGGDLLFGIEEQAGTPTTLTGIQLADVDAQKLRLESMLGDGIDPKLPRVDIHPVALASKPGHYVLILRVQKSWLVHRVIFKDHGHFYSRHSEGTDMVFVEVAHRRNVPSAPLCQDSQ